MPDRSKTGHKNKERNRYQRATGNLIKGPPNKQVGPGIPAVKM